MLGRSDKDINTICTDHLACNVVYIISMCLKNYHSVNIKEGNLFSKISSY